MKDKDYNRVLIGTMALVYLYVTVSLGIDYSSDKISKNTYLYLLLSKICSFFLYVRGFLNNRITEQKYVLFIIVYETISMIYLLMTNEVSRGIIKIIMWCNTICIILLLLGIFSIKRHLPWRVYKRLMTTEMDIVMYHIGNSIEIVHFISQYSSVLYVLSDNLLWIKVVVVVFLYLTAMKYSNRMILLIQSIVSVISFMEIVFESSISRISLFVPSVLHVFLLGTEYQFGWKRVFLHVPKRISIE
ncbi:hypothetical protein NEOKW01_0771 [Nematocida sp. AWRm80]|nr:hypothetical protein NEOKW01_0771 [Nematocida sp. AWRm80]